MMNRGDVYWVDLSLTKESESHKLRLCVILSATPINHARSTVVVVPISTESLAHPPIIIEINCLNKSVVAICDQIRTVDKKRLVRAAGQLTTNDMALLEDSIRKVLSL